MTKNIIEKLTPQHDFSEFDCGTVELNDFIIHHALTNQKAHSVNSYVGIIDGFTCGYYSLVVGSALHVDTPQRVRKGLAKHPIPVIILARLAVDNHYQGKGVGRGLFKDALLRTVSAADIAGIRALLIHAKDDNAKRWYQQFDVEESPTDPLHLFLLMKDIKKIVAR